MQKIGKTWQGYNKELDKVDVKNIREAVRTGYLERTMSGVHNTATDEISLLKWKLNDMNIIEIGGGYGDYAKQLCEKFNVKSYTIIDTKSMIRFAEAYLKEFNIPCTFIDTEKELPDDKYDILISNVCISEIPDDHAKSMLTKLFKQVNKIAIIDIDLKWLDNLIRENFDIISKNACGECKQPNHYIYQANKLTD